MSTPLQDVPSTNTGTKAVRVALPPSRTLSDGPPAPTDRELPSSPRRSFGGFNRRRSSDMGRRASSGQEGRRQSFGGGRTSFAVGRTSLAAPPRRDNGNPYEPPPLEYDLRKRKKSIAIFWSIIVFDSIAMPLGLYFGLWYGTSLSPNTVFSIVTAALGGASIFEYAARFWRLFKKGSTCRVIGGRRAYLDWFHWNFSAGWVIIMVELIIGTIPTNPPIRLLAMPVTSLLYTFALEMLIQDAMRLLGIPSPFRISSMPKNSQLRPGIYWIIEDVVAVDGHGDVTFREQLNARYEASHYFRQMLHRLTLFWGLGAMGMAVLTTILVFTLEHDAAYCVGWAAPFIWAGIWTLITFKWVSSSLNFEKKKWVEDMEKPEV